MDSRQSTFSSFSTLTSFLFSGLVIFLSTNTNATISSSYDRGNETDYFALLSFKSLITHDPYGALSSWNTSFHFCDWIGVRCGKRHKRVTALLLDSQGLEGLLSPHVGNLSFLRVLRLGNNSFQETIPYELGGLFRLRFIDLEINKFNGFIPSNFSGCWNLKTLVLGSNELVGSIPKEIGLLSKLTVFVMQENRLTGGIPPFLGNITSLVMLSLSGNPLGGTIPGTFGHLKSLKVFYLAACNLTGTIPHSVYNLSLLNRLSLSENQLTGSLPLAIGEMLPDLTGLQLSNNRLTWILPPSISNCSKLRQLLLSDNSFCGKLTIDFSKLSEIFEINLGNNLFRNVGADEMKFIDSLNNCTKLESLSLYNCSFEGSLPRSIGNLSDQLFYLDLSINKLFGNLSLSIGNLVGLTQLNLGFNRFIGKLPSTIGMLQKLQFASFYGNQFSGQIPDAIGNLSGINILILSDNNLEGVIASSLGNCHHIEALYLNSNRLSGNIPKQLFQLSSLSIGLYLSENNLFGSLPLEVDLKMLTSLDLSHNNLSGDIPSSLSGCTSLSYLYINDNLFQGIFPPSLISMRGLVELDLSQNNLSGKIPRFLEGFSSLQALNLSFNDFEGEVPVKGVFANASRISIVGNSKLCGGLVALRLPKCEEKKKHKRRFPVFVIVLLIFSSLFVVSCVVYVLYKKKRKGQQPQSLTNERFLKVSYNQLLKATDGFSEAKLIGKGGSSSVYKGVLEHGDRFVAVKVLHLQIRGAHKNFIRECEAWRSIRHRNLLKIITACSSVDFQGNDFKALVYEFMSNGSLHDWLHSSVHTSRINFLQRINILIDIATALDYLHNFCIPTIVHCDLKPNNILLDDDMVAHVGDFGLARFLGTNSNINSTSVLKGTIGYAPPVAEYGLGSEMTSSGDVYSFGILLLEVMTGKYPTHDIFNDGLSLHKLVSTALVDHAITDVIDSNAITLQSSESNAKKVEECLALTLKIGVSCSADSPTQRMRIESVVHELHHIKDVLQNIQGYH
ncbi:receptor kinase-like protein Xa21 [Rutidosis leptorrhynchoides]|uniref:receptor kinase-like protein Xa21 n=1 Tax=Rutidosis leptorrhynchoides TaxID=125765 RepID=UPI003A994D00